MKNLYDLNELIKKYSETHQGVFSISDLKNLFNDSNPVSLYRKIGKLEKRGIIQKFCRGFYITPDVNLEMLSAQINSESYISFGNILARELVIGSIPAKRITCVKTGRKREYENEQGTILYLSISPHLFFGYKNIDGINYADKEKALLDTLYFYQKGQRFSFNIYQDVNYNSINKKLVSEYLTEYRNPKFINFVKGILDERL